MRASLSGAVLTLWDDKISRCLLCGSRKKLSFEHIPPRSCYNAGSRQVHTFRAMMSKCLNGEKFPRGLGRKSLCAECNQFLGREYIDQKQGFAEWTSLGMQLIERGAGVVPCYHPFCIRPGLVGRQIAAIAVAMGNEKFLEQSWFDHLRSIVLNPAKCYTPDRFVFCVYLMAAGTPRLTPFGVPIVKIASDSPVVHCEVSLPPFGYVVFHQTKNLDTIIQKIGLCDISRFVSMPTRSHQTEYLRLRRLTPIGAAPLDYEGVTADEGMI